METICRVCGMEYGTPTWNSENDASFDICNCCGVEFGVQDWTLEGVKEYRGDWISNGAQWFSPKLKPETWNLEEQLKHIPSRWL